MILKRKSILTGKIHEREIDITEGQFYEWFGSNVLIQRAFPHLSADDREFILNGITPEEYNTLYGNEGNEADTDIK